MADTQTVVEYTLSVTIKRAINGDYDPDFTVEEHAQAMREPKANRELEREVLKALRKLDGDCDAEVMETRTFEELI